MTRHNGIENTEVKSSRNEDRRMMWDDVGSLASTELDSGLYVVDYRSLETLQTPTVHSKLSHPFAARAQNSTGQSAALAL